MEEEDEFHCKNFYECEGWKKREATTKWWLEESQKSNILRTFYELTLQFNASTRVTSNLYFKEVHKIEQFLKIRTDKQDPSLSSMARNI